jgi:2-oxo-3-(phosphooxy)propyl 3-oxoalkanoate synthase
MSQMLVVPVNDPSGRIPAPTASLPDELTFLRPVPRELVHRGAVAEVLATDFRRRGDTTFAVAAQWPRDHALYHPDDAGLSDPLLLAETIRQTLFYIAHSYFAIPTGHHFIGQELDFAVTDHLPLRVGRTPLPVVLDATWTWHERHPDRGAAQLDARFHIDGHPCATATLRALLVDDRRYRLLRGTRPAAAHQPTTRPRPAAGPAVTPPEKVGRLRRKDCVLARPAAPTHPWRLRIDRDHAVLFDHPTDHVPLMLMLEGSRQLGHLTLHDPDDPAGEQPFVLAGATVRYAAFGEPDEPIDLVVQDRTPAPHGGHTLRIAATQHDEPLTRADLSWQPAGPARRTG